MVSLSENRREAEEFVDAQWRLTLRPRERLSPAQWIGEHFRHGPNFEHFDFVRFPWHWEPLDAVGDYRIEEQLLICPPQIGKSLSAEGAICYYIVEDPGDLVAYTHTIPLAKVWSEQRVMPSIRKCVACGPFLPSDPKKMRVSEMLMAHMVVEVLPANTSSLQSRSRRLVICDERWLWETGQYDNAKRRADSPGYDGRRKILSYSNSGVYESDVELQWRESDQRVLFANCPACAMAAPFKWQEKKSRRVPETIPGFTIKFEENEVTRPAGVWEQNEVMKTVRLHCPHCKELFPDTPKIRVALRKTMHYVPLNPKASIKSRAWAVSGVAVYSWPGLVRQFINASLQLDLGDIRAMREFILKGLNEPWSEEVIFDSVTNPTGDYSLGEGPWAEGTCAAMTIDVQELAPKFWFVIRDWTADGRSRLRRCGPANTWDELRALQLAEHLPDSFVHVDVTYNSDEVYKYCIKWNWMALRGRPEDYFIHSIGEGRNQIQVRRYFSTMRLVDPAIGTDSQRNVMMRTRAREFMWCDTPVKDVLHRLYSGKGVMFGIPKDVPPFYINQMLSERKMVVETRGNREVRRWVKIGKRPNHLWDCEAMQIVFALIKGPLRISNEDQAPAPPPPNS